MILEVWVILLGNTWRWPYSTSSRGCLKIRVIVDIGQRFLLNAGRFLWDCLWSHSSRLVFWTFLFVREEWHSDRMMSGRGSYWLSGSGNWYWQILWTEIQQWFVEWDIFFRDWLALLYWSCLLLLHHSGVWIFGVTLELTNLQLNSLGK